MANVPTKRTVQPKTRTYNRKGKKKVKDTSLKATEQKERTLERSKLISGSPSGNL